MTPDLRDDLTDSIFSLKVKAFFLCRFRIHGDHNGSFTTPEFMTAAICRDAIILRSRTVLLEGERRKLIQTDSGKLLNVERRVGRDEMNSCIVVINTTYGISAVHTLVEYNGKTLFRFW